MVGCWFEEIGAEHRVVVDRILDHALNPGVPISYSRLLADSMPERRRGVRGLLRR